MITELNNLANFTIFKYSQVSYQLIDFGVTICIQKDFEVNPFYDVESKCCNYDEKQLIPKIFE